MRVDGWLAVAVTLWAAGAAAAEGPVMLGTNPGECEISRALLGVAPAGCPPAPLTIPAAPVVTVAPPPPPAAAAGPSPHAAAPLPAAPAARTERTAAFLINFDFGSAGIRPESRAVLDRVAAVMKAPAASGSSFRIVGHTDGVGSDAGNLALSRRRAGAVVDYLVRRHGIAANRLEAVGMGRSAPLDRANPRAPANRRVEIVSIGG